MHGLIFQHHTHRSPGLGIHSPARMVWNELAVSHRLAGEGRLQGQAVSVSMVIIPHWKTWGLTRNEVGQFLYIFLFMFDL